MDSDGLFSPQMVTVYLSGLTTAGIFFKVITDLLEKRMRRRWEVEDRNYKAEQTRLAEAAEKAARAAAITASKSSRELGEKIEDSRKERQSQMNEVKASMDANTALTQEAKDASKEAIEVANGHNDKILKATELAAAALGAATTKLSN